MEMVRCGSRNSLVLWHLQSQYNSTPAPFPSRKDDMAGPISALEGLARLTIA